MRIISSFHDYYDTVAGPPSRDDLPIYVRREQRFEKDLPHRAELKPLIQLLGRIPRIDFYASGAHVAVEAVLFGFCGRLRVAFVPARSMLLCHAAVAYGTLTEMVSDPNYSGLADHMDKEEARERRIWRRDDVLATLRYRESRRLNQFPAVRALDEFLPEILAAHDTHDLHRRLDTPIFSLSSARSTVLSVNPCLSPRGMYDVSYTSLFGDPRAVYQEIEMYLGTHLAQQVDPIPARTDDLIRDAHGFDKLSFRHGRPDRRARKQR